MSSEAWPAMVLTAGLGTRCRPLTDDRAKPAMPVAGEALVVRILRWLAGCGVRRAVLNLHHRPDTILAAVDEAGDVGVEVQYSLEDPILGSAGGLRRALPLLGTRRFFVVNGDTLTGVDLGALARHHEQSEGLVTMALIPNPDPAFYRGVMVSDRGWVTGFAPTGPANRWPHFIGVQAVDASVVESLPAGRPAETVSELYPRLIAERAGGVRAYHCDASFCDIGTPADYLAASLAIARAERQAQPLIGHRCRINPGARLVRTAIWDDVEIESGAELVECVVGDRARIPAGLRLRRCAVVSASGREAGPGQERMDEVIVARFAAKTIHEKVLTDDAEAR